MMIKRTKRFARDTYQKNRSGMYFLLAGLIVVILPHIGHLPVWTGLTCFSLIIWRLLYEINRLPLPNKYVLFLMFILITLGVLTSYRTIVGREAGTALLLSLICLKLFEIKTLRDISLIVQLGFFAIITTFLFSQSILVAISMLTAVVLLISSLISFQHAKTEISSVPYSEKYHVKLAVKMILYALPLAIIVFMFFPRTGTPLWGLPNDAFAATGLSNTMSPGDISDLVNSQAVAFRVKFQSKIPEPSKRYWRGPVFWAFDGHTWSAPISQGMVMKNAHLVNASNPVEYTITLEPNGNSWLFGLEQAETIPNHAFLTTEMELLARIPVNHLLRYKVTSYLKYTLPWLDGLPRARYLQVPRKSAPRARQYISVLKKQYKNKVEIVNAVLNRFRNKKYYYTRRPPQLAGDPTDAFLFDTKRGFCEHYASSFTVLMRLAGIPARVVTGYQGGEINPLGKYMIVRQSDAHAWSEIYLKGRGWIRVDPTAVIPASNIDNSNDEIHIHSELRDNYVTIDKNWFTSSIDNLRFARDMINNLWNQWVIGYSNQNQKSMFDAIGIPEITWRGLSYVLFLTMSMLTLFMAANIFRAQRIRKNATDKIYQRFLRKLKRLHIEKSPSEGALDFSGRVAQTFPKQAAEIMNIARLYNEMRYSRSNANVNNELVKAIKQLHIER